jgi:hypothetical protein
MFLKSSSCIWNRVTPIEQNIYFYFACIKKPDSFHCHVLKSEGLTQLEVTNLRKGKIVAIKKKFIIYSRKERAPKKTQYFDQLSSIGDL